MIITKTVGLSRVLKWSAFHIVWLLAGSGLVAYLYHEEYLTFVVPWVPVSVIGTAVAFYVGFKNDSSYDRMWEARKIWGAIVNSSRAWGMYVDTFLNNQFAADPLPDRELFALKKKLIYRHIAWLYALRSQLLVPAPWEHSKQAGRTGRKARYYQATDGVGLVHDELTETELHIFLTDEEHDRLINHINPATHIVNQQAKDLADLREKGHINDFRHIEMARTLYHLYEHQGKCERIKKFPFPRQYATMSLYFVGIFIFLLPFTVIPELMELGEWGFWISIPVTALIGWVYVMMEWVGDYSESPFQGMANDIPMLSLCRVIEIDLREILGETELPPAIPAKRGVLM